MHARCIGVASVLALVAMGCQSTGDQPFAPLPSLEGTFVGTYSITHGYSTGSPRTESGGVRLEIVGSHYNLIGERRYMPPSGCGTLHVAESVVFRDECPHTAEFDWTLIVSGDFSYSHAGDRIILGRFDRRLDRLQRFVLVRVA